MRKTDSGQFYIQIALVLNKFIEEVMFSKPMEVSRERLWSRDRLKTFVVVFSKDITKYSSKLFES